MSVEYGTYNGQPGLESGGVVAEHEETWLITDTEHDKDPVELSEMDSQPGRVRIHDLAEDDISYTDMAFESFHLARLAYGLWLRCGPFNQPEGHAVPVEVATDGQAAIAAYLRLNNGYPRSRESVANMMSVSKQTVSNYCRRVRWTPE
jgi:hypothetical protein